MISDRGNVATPIRELQMESPEGCNVFISWSKPRAKQLAQALHEWLTRVNHLIRPWFSAKDIGAGHKWTEEIGLALRGVKFGIICTTAENQTEPWLMFEAGAIANVPGKVCVFRLEIQATEVIGPLSQFQSAEASKEGTLEMLNSLNDSLAPADRQTREHLRDNFPVFWPKLKEKIDKIEAPAERPKERSDSDMIREILSTVRSLERDSLSRGYQRPKLKKYVGALGQRYAPPEFLTQSRPDDFGDTELRDLDTDEGYAGTAVLVGADRIQFVGEGEAPLDGIAHRYSLNHADGTRKKVRAKRITQMGANGFTAELVVLEDVSPAQPDAPTSPPADGK